MNRAIVPSNQKVSNASQTEPHSKLGNGLGSKTCGSVTHTPRDSETHNDSWFGPPSAATKAKLGRKNITYQVRALDRVEGSIECAAVLLELSTQANVANRFTVEVNVSSLSRKVGLSTHALYLAFHDLEHGYWIKRIPGTNKTRLNTETIRRAYVATK